MLRRVLKVIFGALKFIVCTIGLLAVVGTLVGLLVFVYDPPTARRTLAWLGDTSAKVSALFAPELVAERAPTTCVWMDQNWSDADRAWVHNVSQGTATFPVPYQWFQNLERPELDPKGFVTRLPRVSDPAYLERLGFIPPNPACDPKPGSDKPRGYGVLPVGFAVLDAGRDPTTGKETEDGLGLTCAACHTGRILYKNMEFRIDGAPAMINLGHLERVVGLSVCYTNMLPLREDRFIDAVLEQSEPKLEGDALAKKKGELKEQLVDICEQKIKAKVLSERAILERRGEADIEEGFGRLDALNRIGNQVFHENLIKPPKEGATEDEIMKEALDRAVVESNFAAHTAPVSFPPLWDVPNFAWAQYDASIFNPGIRNIGEAIGVTALVNMTNPSDPSRPLYSSSVDVTAIQRIEDLLRGSESPLDGEPGFKGLKAPKWEEAAKYFPDDPNWKAANSDVVTAGKNLYFSLCAECHASPVREKDPPKEFVPLWDRQVNWVDVNGATLFNNTQKQVPVIGTDPEQARILAERTVRLPSYLGVDTAGLMRRCGMKPDKALEKSYALSLMDVVAKVRDQAILDKEKLDKKPMDPATKAAILGAQPNCPNLKSYWLANFAESHDNASASVYVARPNYRARPLDGVWATAPYLHNGSIPTLDDLLTPQDARPKLFCIGPLEFDPKRVGLTVTKPEGDDPSCEAGLSLFDANIRGNSNRGHSFEGDGVNMPYGVIGRGLDAKERENLIAYLKTL